MSRVKQPMAIFSFPPYLKGMIVLYAFLRAGLGIADLGLQFSPRAKGPRAELEPSVGNTQAHSQNAYSISTFLTSL